MAFLLPRSVFIHVPKTGGQWVTGALERAGVPVEPLGVVHTSPDEIAEGLRARGAADRMSFAVVRHPLSWYRSMWAHQADDGWEPIDAVEWFSPRWLDFWAGFSRDCASFEFQDFIERCLRRYPEGLVSTLYSAYTEGVDFVGRQERLADDVEEALIRAGESFDAGRLRATPGRNVRGARRHRARRSIYTRPLVERVLEAEAGAVERFGYWELPKDVAEALEG